MVPISSPYTAYLLNYHWLGCFNAINCHNWPKILISDAIDFTHLEWYKNMMLYVGTQI